MLKRSEYLVMSLSFVLMLAIFLIISINYLDDSSASNNDYTDLFDSSENVVDMSKYDTEYIILTGNDETVQVNVTDTLNYAKKGNATYTRIEGVPDDALESASAIIVTTSNLEAIGDFDTIMKLVDGGMDIFFTSVPQEGSDEYDKYCESMGIVSRRGQVTIDGFQVFEGLYAQGEIVCNDYPLEVEDIRIDATCRTYIFEYTEDSSKDQSEMVPLLWRTVYGEGQICILNADFMDYSYSMGLCLAVLASFESDYVYPIVNAKVNYIDSFPFLSYENGDTMLRLYNRDAQAFLQDQVWQTLVVMMNENDIKFTGLYYAYITDEGSATTLNTETLTYFKKQFSKYDCEFGFGGYHEDRSSGEEVASEAMEKSYDLFNWNLASYKLVTYKYSTTINQSVQNEILADLTDVAVYVSWLESDDEDVYQAGLSFADSNIVNMPIICEEVTTSYEDYWKACNMASGMGLSTHYFDLYDVVTNQSDYDYEWTTYSQELAKQFNLLERGISWLSAKTSTQAAYSAKRYLCLMPEIEITEDEIHITCDNFDDSATFILKTDKRLKADDARYTATVLSDGFYMIEVYKDDVTIELIDSNSLFY